MKAVVGFIFVLLSSFYFFFFTRPVFAADQDLIVNEVMYDFPDSDTNHEWIELFNSGDSSVTIVGGSGTGAWRISDGANHTFSATASQGSMTIAAQGYAIIAKNASTFLADNPGFSGTLIESSIDLNNSSATAGLRVNADGALWGQLTYQSSQGAAGDGNSLQRKTDGSLIAALPTPGRQNAAEAPTPTPTQTPTPTNTPAPTQTPTPTLTPAPTSTPTLTPTPSSSVSPTPTSESAMSVSPTGMLTSAQNGLTTSAVNDALPSGADVLSANTTKKPDTFFQMVSIGIGIVFITICVILTVRTVKKEEVAQNEEE